MANTAEKKMVRGVVVSDKMDKTIVVRSERLVMHPRYRKYVRKFTKYYVHDAENSAREGDTVDISLTRPLSKSKRWRLCDVVTRAPGEVKGADQ